MTRIILFRYHKKPLICAERLAQLKKYNPWVRIFGLYGGAESEFDKYEKYLGKYLEHNYCITGQTDRWKWKNSDLSVASWYRDYGHKLEFDMLHIIEWDLLLFGTLDEIFTGIKSDWLGLTGLIQLSNVESRWNWTSREPSRSEWLELLKQAREKYNYNYDNYAWLGPGTCLPKAFLEKYSQLDIPDLVHDELRLPMYWQILWFKLYDTWFYKKWFEPAEKVFFNCSNIDINVETIKSELQSKTGRRVFHPYRWKLSKDLI